MLYHDRVNLQNFIETTKNTRAVNRVPTGSGIAQLDPFAFNPSRSLVALFVPIVSNMQEKPSTSPSVQLRVPQQLLEFVTYQACTWLVARETHQAGGRVQRAGIRKVCLLQRHAVQQVDRTLVGPGQRGQQLGTRGRDRAVREAAPKVVHQRRALCPFEKRVS